VDPTPVVLDALEMSFTSPLPLNTQPVAGTIVESSGLGVKGSLTACVSELCSFTAGNRASDQTTSLLRGS